jgi:hypothetical protein
MQYLPPVPLVARLRAALLDESHWIVVVNRLRAPDLLGPLVAAVDADPQIGPDDTCRGGVDAFCPPDVILSLGVVLVRRKCLDRARLLELLREGGWQRSTFEGLEHVLASLEPGTARMALNFLNNVYQDLCTPIYPEDIGETPESCGT